MDARVRYTQKVIREVFLSLLKDTPLDKITVTEICQKAQINRATFYKYYNNPADLLDKLEQERLNVLHQKLLELGSLSYADTFRVVLQELKENKDFYQIIFAENGDLEFRDRVFGDCYEYNMQVIQKLYPDLPLYKQKWLFAFCVEGFNGVLQSWQQNGMEAEVDELVDFVRPILNRILKPVE